MGLVDPARIEISGHRSDLGRWLLIESLFSLEGAAKLFGDQGHIGDGLSVMQWVGLLQDAGFESVDILLRDAERVVLASVRI